MMDDAISQHMEQGTREKEKKRPPDGAERIYTTHIV